MLDYSIRILVLLSSRIRSNVTLLAGILPGTGIARQGEYRSLNFQDHMKSCKVNKCLLNPFYEGGGAEVVR